MADDSLRGVRGIADETDRLLRSPLVDAPR